MGLRSIAAAWIAALLPMLGLTLSWAPATGAAMRVGLATLGSVVVVTSPGVQEGSALAGTLVMGDRGWRGLSTW